MRLLIGLTPSLAGCIVAFVKPTTGHKTLVEWEHHRTEHAGDQAEIVRARIATVLCGGDRQECLSYLTACRLVRQESLSYFGAATGRNACRALAQPAFPAAQVGLDGVLVDVAEEVAVLLLVADDMIVGLVHPEGRARRSKNLVRRPRAGALDAVKQIG